MKVIKSFFIAFSIYSKIPMPQFPWKEEDMQYSLCFFPFVGVVIGLLEYLWYLFCEVKSVNILCFSLIGAAIPLIISGGFHIDGFMDTMDAKHSYQPKEKKLEILKDPHIGAFSVIMLACYYLLFVGFFSHIQQKEYMIVASSGFVISRILSGLSVIWFPTAKKNGMLATFASTAQKTIVTVVLSIELVIVFTLLFFINHYMMLGIVFFASVIVIYYFFMSKKEFGGITGDLAGYFVSVLELTVIIFSGIGCIL